MSIYDPLISFLAVHTDSPAVLSFGRIEKILQRQLPDSAKKYPAFWSRGNHLGKALFSVSWQATPKFKEGAVKFRRVGTVTSIKRAKETNIIVAVDKHTKADLILIGCVKSKLEGRHRAEDLYTSTLFQGRAAYARSTGKPWFVLSSEYGLLRPDEVIDTYDVALKNMPAREKYRWSRRVLDQVDREIENIRGKIIEIHAGKAYRDYGFVQGLVERGAKVSVPLAHLRQGEQLNWYSTNQRY
jgi:hypothetical protein